MRSTLSRRGLSEIIAALMVVCITISATALFAIYASGLMGSILKPVTSQPYTEQLTLDYYCWNTSSYCNGAGNLKITVRNSGAATITLSDFFMQGVKNTTDLTPSGCASPNSYVLAVQSTCTLTFPAPTTLTVTSGLAYTVKLVANDGTIFTFSCIAGSYSH